MLKLKEDFPIDIQRKNGRVVRAKYFVVNVVVGKGNAPDVTAANVVKIVG